MDQDIAKKLDQIEQEANSNFNSCVAVMVTGFIVTLSFIVIMFAFMARGFHWI